MAIVISNPNSPDGMFTYEEAQANAHLFQGGTYYYSPSLGGYVPAQAPAHVIDPSMLGGRPGGVGPQAPGIPGMPGGTTGTPHRRVRRITLE